MEIISDEQLVSLYKSGDATAFNIIYDRYTKTVKYFARNLYLLGADYEDLLQEGMLGLIKAVNLYKEGESSFRTFATLCIKSSLYTAVKKYSANNLQPLNDSVEYDTWLDKYFVNENPEDETIRKEAVNELIKLISDKLSKTEQKVLNLYLEGLSYEEISKSLGMNFKSIDNALQRARKKIKSIGE
ncbi:MAG: sigma-70 family RNA polymerase sigma factor [Clostridia bacterium]|nr:sigma-70 family RNA polymerase sigma factor [Clostridia bacterium]